MVCNERTFQHLSWEAADKDVSVPLPKLKLVGRKTEVRPLDDAGRGGRRPPHLERTYAALDLLSRNFSVPTSVQTATTNLPALLSGATGKVSARERRAIQKQASLEVYRLFDHPVRDAAIREFAELDLRTTFKVSPNDLPHGRPEIPLREENELRRDALRVLLGRSSLIPELRIAAIEKLGEVGTPDDVKLIDRAARRGPKEATAAAMIAKAKISKAAKMTIVLAGFEAKPYVNGGGLGNVMKELPPALARLGHRVIVVLPRHSVIERDQLEETGRVGVVYGPKTEKFGLFRHEREGVDYYFIENDRFFSSGRNGVYRDSYGDYGDGFERYDFFGAALPVAIRTILGKDAPDVVQLNDAHTAAAAAYLKADPAFSDTATVMAIHNLGAAYQGRYGDDRIRDSRLDGLGLYYPGGPAEAWGDVNLLKLGLTESDGAITVSRQYMHEILDGSQGEGLDGVLRSLKSRDKLWGNLNGIDTTTWNSETDPLIPAHFSFEDRAGKGVCKASLQEQYGLPVRPDVPLFGVVARMSAQKGIDDIIDSARRALSENRDMQLVVCGEGQDDIKGAMAQLAHDFPDRVAYDGEFTSEKEHTILAGSDFFLMPSRFEPCGLPQMYALRYLTVPIVRAVGGLEESIEDGGNGFKFTDDLYGAVDRALAWYNGQEDEREAMLKRCADSDFSWDTSSAPEQVAFYRKVINER